jgi:hypothetical protein
LEFAQGTNSRFFENLETSTSEVPSYTTSSPNPPRVEHVEEPMENREGLDDVSTPFTDRHNYLVTGQLSQERQQQPLEDLRERQVTGTDEAGANVPPPGLNRMVTGTETMPENYLSYQRQADGEVSVQRPPMPPAIHHATPATTDRNLYLVAGESDVNNQRVIPGVESDSSLPPMANLHIQDDDDFVQERNVTVDGMETAMSDHRVIDGANDNSEVPAVVPTPEPESSEVREEAIEGANDEKVQKLESSEDSELRELEEKKLKPKGRRQKKYTDDSIDSDIDDDERHRRKESYRKEKRSGKRGEETDGSKYGRRTDDEEDYRRNRDKYKRSSRGRNGEEGEEKERKKRDKYREGGSRRSKFVF